MKFFSKMYLDLKMKVVTKTRKEFAEFLDTKERNFRFLVVIF